MFVWVDVYLMVVVTTVVEDPEPRVYVRVWSPVWTGELPPVLDAPVVNGMEGPAVPPVLKMTEELPGIVGSTGVEEAPVGELPRLDETEGREVVSLPYALKDW